METWTTRFMLFFIRAQRIVSESLAKASNESELSLVSWISQRMENARGTSSTDFNMRNDFYRAPI